MLPCTLTRGWTAPYPVTASVAVLASNHERAVVHEMRRAAQHDVRCPLMPPTLCVTPHAERAAWALPRGAWEREKAAMSPAASTAGTRRNTMTLSTRRGS